MKRLSLVALFLLGSALGAQADTDIYNNIARYPRGDDALQVDIDFCSQELGAPQNGMPTPRPYRSCMLARGWRFSHTVRERPGWDCSNF
jgi:hypothetical protein